MDQCIRFPVLTFASGSTNSMIGAAHLTGIQNGIVIDVGGTSTDIGVIVNGRPRHTHAKVYLVDDIRVNMSMPDVLSLPLGGGTIIHVDEEAKSVCVGPDSVGYQLITHGLAFGGQTITGTDVALAANLTSQIGHSTVHLPSFIIEQVLDHIINTISRGIDRMKTNQEPIPVILCGGGSILISPEQTFDGVTQMIRPPHFAVCNAVGAALCQVSATIESIVDLVPSSIDDGMQRKREIDRLTLQVQQQCERNGAHPNTVHLVDIEQVPLAYYPGGYKHRVLLTAIGQLNLSKMKGYHQQSTGQQLLPKVPVRKPQLSKPPTYMNMVNKQPMFDENGLWVIDPIDIEYIAYGVGILGKAKFSHHNNVIQAVAQAGHGQIVVADGKVVSVERNTGAGFARGHVIVDVEGRMLTIDFQNENLVARFEDNILASVPDLITLVEQDSGEPLSTETVKYGCRVSVLVLPASETMSTQEALKYVGPRAFGYDHDYIPPSHRDPVKSVWDVYYNKPSMSYSNSIMNDRAN
ncbi:unnamed protein product [Rotaria sp. Silwood2]|nr:unnamed protein product [Rotaria sp. Silwood2]